MGHVEETQISAWHAHAPAALEVSVVIPCLNERLTLPGVIRQAMETLAAMQTAGEVIVADNGSTDGSPDLAAEHGARVVNVASRGYGAALTAGVAAARGTFVVMGDADGSYDFSSMPDFLERLRAGAELVVGNRFDGGIEEGAMPLLHRYLGNPLLSFIGRRLFGTGCGDVYCGLRAFRRETVVGFELRSRGMEYALEMIVKAELAGCRVEEVPTRLYPDGRNRKPHLRTWSDGWRSLRLLLLYSPRWLFLYPGLALSVTGLAIFVWLLPRQRAIGGVVLDVHTLFYAAVAVVLGTQAIASAVLAHAFAVADGLLPESAVLPLPFRWLNARTAFAVGSALAVIGLAASATAVALWDRNSFGRLEYSHSMRYVIPGGVSLALGCELVLAAFVLSLFDLRRR